LAKKSRIIDLRNQKISYEQNNLIYKVISFKTSNMTVDVSSFKDDKLVETSTIAFAHLPKAIKGIINPV